jgi:Photosynthetic reaction centre cytochrome C subunit
MTASLRFLQPVVAVLLTSVAFMGGTGAQAPEGARNSAGKPPPLSRTFHAPRNLKVLPRDLSGQQVNEIMEGWARSLGVRCDSCHAEATEITVADDESNLNYADDSKQMKIIARSMYKMTEEINSIHIAKIEGSGMPVTCGTCHRGHVSPEPFIAPSHDAPPSNVRSAISTNREPTSPVSVYKDDQNAEPLGTPRTVSVALFVP